METLGATFPLAVRVFGDGPPGAATFVRDQNQGHAIALVGRTLRVVYEDDRRSYGRRGGELWSDNERGRQGH